ncbi:MAG: hypothetical protein AVDCRST_MAG30-194, partial [uncultured Solirubrobacteraceae bacterium]
AAPDAHRVDARVRVVGLDHDLLGEQLAVRRLLHRAAHVDDAVRAVLRRHEPALHLHVGDRERTAGAVGDREGAHRGALLPQLPGRGAAEPEVLVASEAV